MANLTRVAFVAALSSSLACEGIIGVCTLELGVVVEPTDATVHVGQSVQFEAYGTSCGGREIITLDVRWESSDSAVVRVEPTGRVTGRSAGSAHARGVDRSRYSAGPIEVPVEVVP
jgi:hypothetical protein